jgi:steroid 5-alpha reductase family enzyme
LDPAAVASLLAINAALLVVGYLALWALSLRLRDVSFIDAVWAFGMAAMAWTTFIQVGEAGPHRLLLVGLCTLWAARLGGHLLLRWRAHGEDPRYARMMADAKRKQGWDFPVASLLLVFALQAPLLFIVCLPVQLGQLGATPAALGPLAWTGAALAGVGLVFETVGDWQLTRFRNNPENKGRVLDTGLWRYTRHPNYFGDACLWWGLFLIAAETPLGVWAIPGPLLLTWTLMKWSGAPMLEGRLKKTRPEYADYIARTSGFIPWPPRRPQA